MVQAVRLYSYSTRDPGEAHESLRTMYTDHAARFFRSPRPCRFDVRSLAAGGLSHDLVTYSLPVQVAVDGRLDHFHVTLFGVPGVRVTSGREELRCARGDVFLLPVDRPSAIAWDHLQVNILRFPMDRAADVAAAWAGIDAADFRFDGMVPVSEAAARNWRATMAYVRRALDGPSPVAEEPLIREAVLHGAAMAAVATFPNSATTAAYRPGPGHVAPAAVRRAVQYVDAHAHQPVTLADIAAAAGVGARGLQASFARHVGVTPIGYLRRVRLEHAHRELQAGDPARGDTVAAVARRWGYANPGRFAAEYRAAFGCVPSHTLRT